jgi:hypothetical protein
LTTHQQPAHNFLLHWDVEPWPEAVDGGVLLNDLCEQFIRYVVLPEHAAIALPLWVLHTWVFEHFDVTPYLSITSFRLRWVSLTSAAALFRLTLVGEWCPPFAKWELPLWP